MSDEAKKQKKQKIIIILLSVGIAVCIAVTVWTVFFRDGGEPPQTSDYASQKLEPNAEPVTGDESKLNVPKGGGGISVEYNGSVTVDLSDNKATFQYIHPKRSTQNIILQIMIKDTVIAQSGLITPGNQLKKLTLFDGAAKKLSAGTYTDAKFNIMSYDPESGEKAMVDTVAQITINVKE